MVSRARLAPTELLALLRDDNAPLDSKVACIEELRGRSPELGEQVTRLLVEQQMRLRQGLRDAQETQEELKDILDKLSAPPWHTAAFMGCTSTPQGERLVVLHSGALHVVTAAEELAVDTLQAGDPVYLSDGRNMAMAPASAPPFGDTAIFDRYTEEGSLVLKHRDEEVVVPASSGLREVTLTPGDRVLWDPSLRLAHGRLEGSQFDSWFLDEPPEDRFEDIGGLDEQIEELQNQLALRTLHAGAAKRYDVEPARAVLLTGPPGTGKTLLARGGANWLQAHHPDRRSLFLPVAPGQLNTMWFGETEARYREIFAAARRAAVEADHVILFFDELDSIASTRGQSIHRVDDKVMMAFASELDGFQKRAPNVIVIGASNRADAIDPAILRPGRFGDLSIEVPRPGQKASADILGRYLSANGLPYHDPRGKRASEEIREEIIDATAAHIFSPNGIGALAMIACRNNDRRPVMPADLISGAVIARIAREAKLSA
ncbi:MAG: AAA family ATPase, partial [Planctomycetota bacterium]